MKKFGGQLFDFLFPGPILDCLEQSRRESVYKGLSLRIQIRLNEVPELCDLPWEFLHDHARFIGLSVDTPIVRYLEVKQPSLSIDVRHPLRILAVISSPSDYPQLDVDREWSKLQEAVKGLSEKGLVMIERLDAPRLSRLHRRLRADPCHILHFIGHGDFDDESQAGQLYLEDENRRAMSVSAEQLGVALMGHHSIQLVVLNACEGARSSRTDPFSGTAQRPSFLPGQRG